jgi:hypothetical protein
MVLLKKFYLFFFSLFFRKEFVESASPILLKSQSGRQEGNIYLYIKEEENKQREKDDEPNSDDIRYSHSLFFPFERRKKKTVNFISILPSDFPATFNAIPRKREIFPSSTQT